MDLTALAFELADKYRNPVIVLADGIIAQSMEPVELREYPRSQVEKDYAVNGCAGRGKRKISSAELVPEKLERHDLSLQRKYEAMRAAEQRWAGSLLEGARVVLVAYGTVGRVAQTAAKLARAQGLAVGLFRPISLFPFPADALDALGGQAKAFLVSEMSSGQMVEDVRLVVDGRLPVYFYGRQGGMVPSSLGRLLRWCC
jgi:2-oxoglutarate ferredoxin oxidoreductase subunit alpha